MQQSYGAIELRFKGGRATGGEFYGADFFFGESVLVIFLSGGTMRIYQEKKSEQQRRASSHRHLRKDNF